MTLASTIYDEIQAVRKKVRASEHDLLEAVWRIAIRANVYETLPDLEGVRLRPYQRFARPKLERVTAALRDRGPLGDGESRTVELSLPERVIAELHELAAHVDRTASSMLEHVYRFARASL